MIGIWKGYYVYNNEIVQKAVGYEKTNFVINIDFFDGKFFKGTVQDDISTGGMGDIGLIEGYIEEDKVFFKKLMPRERLIIDKKGTRKTTNKKHPTLLYAGTRLNTKKSVSGKWKFKITVGFLFGLIPIPFRSASGSWSMDLENVQT